MNDFAGIKNYRPILCLDFDGVIHSYSSGWKGARNIPDPPVPGALGFIIEAMKHFEIHIYSSRSRYFGGRRAMKNWLREHFLTRYIEVFGYPPDTFDILDAEIDIRRAVEFEIIKKIKFPLMKPAAFLQIDDRAVTFTGKFSEPEEYLKFKPWNKV